jgi:hypothetical protein
MTISRSAAELLARASWRERVVPADARSGAVFERVVVGPDRYFVKQVSFASDWVMRASGDHVYRQYLVWQAGIMDQSPDCIDHTVAAMGLEGAGDDAVLTIMMRDIGEFLVPPGDAIVPAGQHAGFIAHMAALHRAFWDRDDQAGLTTMAQRVRLFAPDTLATELAAAEVPVVAAAAAAGWTALPRRSPLLWQLAGWSTTGPRLSPGRCHGRRARSWRSTGRWVTSALTRTGGPSCWTGPSPAPGPPAGTCAGTGRSTGPGRPNLSARVANLLGGAAGRDTDGQGRSRPDSPGRRAAVKTGTPPACGSGHGRTRRPHRSPGAKPAQAAAQRPEPDDMRAATRFTDTVASRSESAIGARRKERAQTSLPSGTQHPWGG